jgi:hypothetical protein
LPRTSPSATLSPLNDLARKLERTLRDFAQFAAKLKGHEKSELKPFSSTSSKPSVTTPTPPSPKAAHSNNLTASLGVAPTPLEPRTPDIETLAAARNQQAKDLGKNRVVAD